MVEREHGPGGIFSARSKKADVVDDAVALATAAVRIAVKNLLIVRALRDYADFDEQWWLAATAHEFEVIAVEKESDAARVEEERAAAKHKKGKARHPGDFRTRDVPKLKKRARVLHTIAARLRELAADDEALHRLITEARQGALDEIATARHDPTRTVARDPAARDAALAQLAEDLADLAASRQDESPTPGTG